MDMGRGFEEPYDRHDGGGDANDGAVGGAAPPPPPGIGTDERRMQVRAYNHWASLLDGRPFPAIGDLHPERIADFGPHSVLIDFSRGLEDPTIPFLGSALRAECAIGESITRVAEVPARSLLSRLTDHYLQIIANRVPIGFEAEFIDQRGLNTLYRGILMPFSAHGDTIDYIYGVINWKQLVDDETQARLGAELDEAVRNAPREPLAAPVWADGPSAGLRDERFANLGDDSQTDEPTLADMLATARDLADAARTGTPGDQQALVDAVVVTHELAMEMLADPMGAAMLFENSGVEASATEPMLPLVTLAFGAGWAADRLESIAALLAEARVSGWSRASLVQQLGEIEFSGAGGDERPRPAPMPLAPTQDHGSPGLTIADRPAIARVAIADHRDWLVLVARRSGAGMYDVVGACDDDHLLADAMRRVG